MIAPRTEDIAATAGELHQLLQGATPAWSEHLLGKLNPNVPYVCRALAAGLRAFAVGKVTAEQCIQFMARLLDCDYKTGENSYRAQKELAELFGFGERTVRRYDAAMIKAGLVTKKQARRGPAVFTMIAPKQLDHMFGELGGHVHAAAQDRPSSVTDQKVQDRPISVAGQDDLRQASHSGRAKIKTGQNEHLRPASQGGRLPYTDHKKKEVQAHTQAREPMEVIGHAFLSWALRGDPGWSDGFRSAFGDPPDSQDCRIYTLNDRSVRRGVDDACDCIRRKGKERDDFVMLRIQIIARRIKETAERRLCGAKASNPPPTRSSAAGTEGAKEPGSRPANGLAMEECGCSEAR